MAVGLCTTQSMVGTPVVIVLVNNLTSRIRQAVRSRARISPGGLPSLSAALCLTGDHISNRLVGYSQIL